MSTRAATTRRRWNLPAFIVLTLVCLLMVFPLIWLVGISLKAPHELNSFPTTWWPESPQWKNYRDATDPAQTFSFWKLARNSLLLSLISATLTTLVSALVAYGFARLPGGRLKKVLFVVLIVFMMMPPIITLIPTFLMFTKLNLVGTWWPWVLWGLSGSTWTIFLLRQFFMSIPREIDEAATMDGCGWFGVFWRMIIPLSVPAMVTVFVQNFVATWSDFITPSLLLSPENTTLAVGVATGYVNNRGYSVNNLMAAGTVLYIIPIIVLFFLVQRAYVQGFTSSGLKG